MKDEPVCRVGYVQTAAYYHRWADDKLVATGPFEITVPDLMDFLEGSREKAREYGHKFPEAALSGEGA